LETAGHKLAIELAAFGLEARWMGTDLATSPNGLHLQVDPHEGLGAEGYRLEVVEGGVLVTGGEEIGVFYGMMTLLQWIRLHAVHGEPLILPGLRVEDAPDLEVRGVMLDISRDRVPTVETMLDLVDRLSEWKINQLQLYMEHTFAYPGHEVVWEQASPWTAQEIRQLDVWCRDRGIELVPNQNSWGHLHRWLRHDRYRPLAECPDGIEHPFSDEVEPFSLCPTDPEGLAFLEGLYDELLPCFGSDQLNVGLDEAIDLGRCRSREVCERRGAGAVLADFVVEIHELVSERGRRMQMWGDMLHDYPEVLGQIPRDSLILEWGYEAGHSFSERAGLFQDAGLSYLLCPGTSSWASLAGRADNALANLAGAAVAAQDGGAQGLLICDWGDYGHLQPLPVSYLGLLAGAGFAWNVESARRVEALDVAGILDRHAFADRAGVMGKAALELGNLYRTAGGRNFNGSSLFFLLLEAAKPLSESRAHGVTVESLEATLEQASLGMELLGAARLARPDAGLVVEEMHWVGDLLRVAGRLGLARLRAGESRSLAELPRGERQDLLRRLAPLSKLYRRLWTRRSRPGGLEDSARRLERIEELLKG
jgi:hypothetical protein